MDSIGAGIIGIQHKNKHVRISILFLQANTDVSVYGSTNMETVISSIFLNKSENNNFRFEVTENILFNSKYFLK